MEISILPSDIVNLIRDLKKIKLYSEKNRILGDKCRFYKSKHPAYKDIYRRSVVEKKVNDANLIFLIGQVKEVVLLAILLLEPEFGKMHQHQKDFYNLPYLLNHFTSILKESDVLNKQDSESILHGGARGNLDLDPRKKNVLSVKNHIIESAERKFREQSTGAGQEKITFQEYLKRELENYFKNNDMDNSQKRKLISEVRKYETSVGKSREESNKFDSYVDSSSAEHIKTKYASTGFHQQLLKQQKLLRQLDRLKHMQKLKNNDVEVLSKQLSDIEKLLEGSDFSRIIPTVGDEPLPPKFATVLEGVNIREIPSGRISEFKEIMKTKKQIDDTLKELRQQKNIVSNTNYSNESEKRNKLQQIKNQRAELKIKKDEIQNLIKQMKLERKQEIEEQREQDEQENSVPSFVKRFGSMRRSEDSMRRKEIDNSSEMIEEQLQNIEKRLNNINPKKEKANANVHLDNTQAKQNNQEEQENNFNLLTENITGKNKKKDGSMEPPSVDVTASIQKPEIPAKEQIAIVFKNINKLREYYQRDIILYRRYVGINIYDKYLQIMLAYIASNQDSLKTRIDSLRDRYDRSINLSEIILEENKVILSDLKNAIKENRAAAKEYYDNNIVTFIGDDGSMSEESAQLVIPIYEQVVQEYNNIKNYYKNLDDTNNIEKYKIMDAETYDIIFPSSNLFKELGYISGIDENSDQVVPSELASIRIGNNTPRLIKTLHNNKSNANAVNANENANAANPNENSNENENENNNNEFYLAVGEDEAEEGEDEEEFVEFDQELEVGEEGDEFGQEEEDEDEI